MGATHTPHGMVFQMATSATPARLKEAMEAAGIDTDRGKPFDRADEVDWADTIELRFYCSEAVQFTILNKVYTDPDDAIYSTVAADDKYLIPVNLAHEVVYFKQLSVAGVLTAELYGSQTLSPLK